jgi:hypothetical protein
MRIRVIRAAALVFGLTLSTVAAAESLGGSQHGNVGVTHRRVAGVITSIDVRSVEDTQVTISAPAKVSSRGSAVTGRIDTATTRIIIDGHPAHPSDLKLTDKVKGEINMDGVWLTLSIETL